MFVNLSTIHLDNLKKELLKHLPYRASVGRFEPVATDLTIEDYLPGSTEQHELFELARYVKAKFRKHFEPIFEQKFEQKLLCRVIPASLTLRDSEKELTRFLDSLSNREFIVFMLYVDDDTFKEQSWSFQTLLQSLRNRTKVLLSQKDFYNLTIGSQTIISSLSDNVGPTTRLEQLMTTQKEGEIINLSSQDCLDKLEGYLLGSVDFRINWISKRAVYMKSITSRHFEDSKATKFQLRAYDLLYDYQDDWIKSEDIIQILPEFEVPTNLLEKWIMFCLLASSEPLGRIEKEFYHFMAHPAVEIRCLDLFLRILAIKQESYSNFVKLTESYFECKITGSDYIKMQNTVNSVITGLLARRSREATHVTPFYPLLEKCEQDHGVLPFKQHLISEAVLPLLVHHDSDINKDEKVKSFVEIWCAFSERLPHVITDNSHQYLRLVIEYLWVNEETSVEEGSRIHHLLTLCQQSKTSKNLYSLTDENKFYLIKKPRILQFLLQHLLASKHHKDRLESFYLQANSMNSHLKAVLSQNKALVWQNTTSKELEAFMEALSFFQTMYNTYLSVVQEVLDRLEHKTYYPTSDRSHLLQCQSLLRTYAQDPQMKVLHSCLVGVLERIEDILVSTEGKEPDKQANRFIVSLVRCIICFYRLYQVSEEFQQSLLLDKDVSPALLRIKSRVQQQQQLEETPSLRLDRTMSSVLKEDKALTLEEVMFRLPVKCKKVLKIYLKQDPQADQIISMVPWTISQSERLEFLR